MTGKINTKAIVGVTKRTIATLKVKNGIFGNPDPEQQEMLDRTIEYISFRRVKSEQQLEKIKELLAGYMFDPNVVIQGAELNSKGEIKYVQLSKFDAMTKAVTLYLATVNIQNKLWGLYTTQQEPRDPLDPPPSGALNAKTLAHDMVQELQRMAKKKPALPVSARVVDNGK